MPPKRSDPQKTLGEGGSAKSVYRYKGANATHKIKSADAKFKMSTSKLDPAWALLDLVALCLLLAVETRTSPLPKEPRTRTKRTRTVVTARVAVWTQP